MREILSTIVLLFSCYTHGAIVISDLDETIKMTNVANKPRALQNALFSTKVFEPIPKLLQGFDSYTNGIYILSASPNIFNRQIKKLLTIHEIPYRGLYTRKLTQLGDKKRYKMQVINELIQGEDTVILLGDNVDQDVEIYHEVRKRYPQKNFVIYIHRVAKKEVTQEGVQYYTAFEIAVNEYMQKRMNYYQVAEVAAGIVKQKSMKDVISNFAECPTNKEQFNYKLPLELKPLALGVETRILHYCKQRNKK